MDKIAIFIVVMFTVILIAAICASLPAFNREKVRKAPKSAPTQCGPREDWSYITFDALLGPKKKDGENG